ncbi:MAG: ROK family protein, partial [Burkholderiaceae bacterium]
MIRLGIDLGGTKIEIIALDAAGTPLLRRRVAAPQGDYAATVAAIVGLVEQAESDLGGRGTVGLGIPGSISPHSGLVRNANSTWINGQPLQRDLQARLGREIRVANDANCFTVSEAVDGAAAGCGSVFGVILGTGVGGGLVIGGGLVAGANQIAGEWGHAPLPPQRLVGRPIDAIGDADERPGPACWCGRYGCIETWLSGPGWAAEFRRRV